MPFLKSILNYIGGQSADQSKGERNTQLVNDVCLEDTEILKEKSKVEAVEKERADSDFENNENNCQKVPAENALNLCDETGNDRRTIQPKEAEKNEIEIQNNNDSDIYGEDDSFVSAKGENDLVMNGSPTTIFGSGSEGNNGLNYKAIDSESEVKTNVSAVLNISNVSGVNEETSSHTLEVSENDIEECDIDLPLEESLTNNRIDRDRESVELPSYENRECIEPTTYENADNVINQTEKAETIFKTEHSSIASDDNIITNIDKDLMKDCPEVEPNELINSPAKNIDLSSNSQKFIDAESGVGNSAAIEAKVDETAICGHTRKEGTSNNCYFQNRDNAISEVRQLENQSSKQSVADFLVNETSNQSVSTAEISMDIDSTQCSSGVAGSSSLTSTPLRNIMTHIDSNQCCSALDASSSLIATPLHNVVTQQMVDEEERYEEEDKVEAEQHRNLVKDEILAAPEDQRFERLQKLLDKSNAYARFILNKMNHQRDEEKQRREAKQKRAAEVAKKKSKEGSSKDQVVPEVEAHRTRSGASLKDDKNRKRKRGADKDSEQESSQESSSGSSKRQKTGKKGKKSKIKEQFAEAEMDAEDHDNNKEVTEKQGEQATRKINGEAVSHRQPLLISGGVMRSYQLDGLDWMRGLFENGINGILADEMGLGKTLQCISLISYLVERNLRGPFLVAAPLSTLPNWVSEFKKFAPKLNTILYHGSIEERAAMRSKIAKVKKIDPDMKIKANPVVITSYEIVMRDRVHLNGLPWKYIIIDEGHRIKNLNCKLIRELKTYKTANRLLLTGTPLQNNLAELWSLLNFLLPDIFDDLNSFQEWFDFSAVSEDGGDEKIIAQEQETNVLQTLHAILTPFLLRRLKTDVDLSIPPKRELIVYAPLTVKQGEFYKSTLDRTILSKIREKSKPKEEIEYTPSGRPKRKSVKSVDYTTMLNDDSEDFDFDALLDQMNAAEDRKKAATAQQNAAKAKSMVSIRLQNIMMQLRKCCNHPYLLEYPLDPQTQEVIVNEHLVNVSGKMQLLDRMLAELKRRGHKVLIFSQFTTMLDIIQDFCYMRSYSFSRIDGTMKIPERQEMIETFNNDPDTFLFLLSTRAGGLGLNLSAADTCIIYDSDWNPQVDLQAQDRCHRIGQTKPVLIFRYVTANSIDERVVERAASKRKLEKMVIHKGHFKGKQMSSKLSPQELLDLLRSKDHSQVSGMGQDFAITDECLNHLLDRSALLSHSESKTEPEPTVESNLFKIVEQTQDDAIF